MSTLDDKKQSLLDIIIAAWYMFCALGMALFLFESVIICIRKPWCLLISLIVGCKLIMITLMANMPVWPMFIPFFILFVFIMTSYYADEYRDEYLKNNNMQAEPLFKYNYIPWYTQVTRIFGCSFFVWLIALVFYETAIMQYFVSILRMFS